MEFIGEENGGWTRAGDALRQKEARLLERVSQRNRLRDLVAAAIAEDRVRLAFQPVVFAARTDRTAFLEGLVRIELEDGSHLQPGAILPKIAGLPEAAELDAVVLRLALDALAGNPGLRLSINVAPATIGHGDWLRVLAAAARQTPDVCFRLIVEITETASLFHKADVPRFIAAVRRTGANIALDDFGAGYTSFRYFRDLRFDMVKIDGSFGDGLADDPDAQCLVRALVGIAEHFEMVSVAEHIADPRDAAAARNLGIGCLQGNLFGGAAVTPEVPHHAGCDAALPFPERRRAGA